MIVRINKALGISNEYEVGENATVGDLLEVAGLTVGTNEYLDRAGVAVTSGTPLCAGDHIKILTNIKGN